MSLWLGHSQGQVNNRISRGVFFAVPVLLSFLASPVCAQQSLSAAADKEIVRRQEVLLDAEKKIIQADKAAREKNYEEAYVKYLDALEKIPAGSATGARRAVVIVQFSSIGIAYANDLVKNGRYSDAERVAKTVLLPEFNPGYKPAVQFLANLEQSDYYNKTVTPQFAADRDQVVKLMVEADGYYASGRFDLASKRYEQVLNIDRYNNAARMGLEKVNKQKNTYYSAAYDETRSRMLWNVTRAWERPVHRMLNRDTVNDARGRRTAGSSTEAITAKLNRIIIPNTGKNLDDVTIRDAVEYLKQQSRMLDTTATDPKEKKGVNIVLKLASPSGTTAPGAPAVPGAPPVAAAPAVAGAPAAPDAGVIGSGATADTKVILSLKNVPLIEALRYLTEQAGLKFKVEPYAVSIVPVTENTDELLTKEFNVPPGFIPLESSATAGAAAAPTAGTATAGITTARLSNRTDAKKYLESLDVGFPQGASAQYSPGGTKLTIRNTQDNLDLISMIVDAAAEGMPKQVEIEAKFLEISQDNLKELGFNWLLGPLSIGGGMYGAGGTQGYGGSPAGSTYPFNAGSGPVGTNPVTGGLRSGYGATPDAAISANSLDALLAGVGPGALAAAPGILGISGIFTNPQFQLVIRALNQKKGVDLMSAPKVTTKPGNRAVIKVVRQFPYPTEFSPPTTPAPATGGTSSTTTPTVGFQTQSGMVSPSTPTAFQNRDVGVVLEVEPVVGTDNYTIDLSLAPQVVEFDGFINYGSPILAPAIDMTTLSITSASMTDNVVNQPIFSVRKVTTNVSIWDGQTVAMGGLIREDVQKVQDKVPILGDIPLAGRLFRSDVDQKIKRNLIIFVTARLMDAEGRPIRQEEEQEEVVEPIGLPENLPPPTFKSRGK